MAAYSEKFICRSVTAGVQSLVDQTARRIQGLCDGRTDLHSPREDVRIPHIDVHFLRLGSNVRIIRPSLSTLYT